MSSRPSLILIRALRTPTARVQVRLLATKPPPAPLDPHPFLSQLNNPRPSSSGSRLAGDPHVGPFPLPPGSSERDAGIRAAERSWRQLGTGQKGARGGPLFSGTREADWGSLSSRTSSDADVFFACGSCWRVSRAACAPWTRADSPLIPAALPPPSFVRSRRWRPQVCELTMLCRLNRYRAMGHQLPHPDL